MEGEVDTDSVDLVVIEETTGTQPFANCSEAKAAGAAPLHKGDAGYSTSLDRDGDGVACEK
ncbi:excalibur calcium-binding domain-containing protein [Longirhabdus pacifica]|uniref:excalibur calcium-binding domain-containing protein n=1 Tax=Longirhabdus pacifica TaxID=2305227 RepID=UPI001F0CCC98|nr:excalibur calcium-binding domain-containing protein [Longirhabdus pacifica]